MKRSAALFLRVPLKPCHWALVRGKCPSEHPNVWGYRKKIASAHQQLFHKDTFFNFDRLYAIVHVRGGEGAMETSG
jgi:hypothetical protein